MARVEIPVTTILTTGVTQPAQVIANVSLGNYIATNDGRIFLEAKNDDASTQTVTVVTQYTQDGFTLSDLVISLVAGGTKLFGPFATQTFNKSDLTVEIDASDADIKFRAYKL
jgi:hypothetical protein